MSDGAFQTFKEFLIQQSKAECGVQDLHLEQVGRLAAFLVGDDAERSTAYLQIALNWLNEGKIGLASSSPLRRSQSFWYCMRNGRLPAS